MIKQFVVLGIYQRNQHLAPYDVVYEVIVDGKIVETCKRRGTALLRLAEELDKKVGA